MRGAPLIQFQTDDRPEIRLQKLRRLAEAVAAIDLTPATAAVTPTPTGITMTGPAVLGRLSGTGEPLSLTGAQATTILSLFTAGNKGVVPAPGTATGNRFLRDDGGWATVTIPPGSVLHADLAGLLADDHTQYVLRSILTADGDLFTRASGVVDRLAIGTSAQFLRAIGGAPSWDTVSPTLTLGTDLSGNTTFTDLANATLNATIVNDAVTDVKLRNSAGLSVIGRSANTTGDPADIAGTDGQILRVAGTSLAFGSILSTSISDFVEAAQDAVGGALVDSSRIDFTYSDGANTITADIVLASVDTAYLTDNSVTNGKLRDSAALSVIGRSVNSTGDPADIAGTDGQILRVSGTTLSFGSILSTSVSDFNEAAQDAVGNILTDSSRIDFTYSDGGNTITADIVLASVDTAYLTDNAITNAKLRDSAALSVIGRSANSTGDPADIAGTDGQILRVSGTALGFGSVLAASISDFTEAAQDAVGGAFVDSSRIDFTYSDVANTITADIVLASVDTAYLTDNAVTNAKIRDSVALSVIGRSANSTGDPGDIAGADGQILRVSGTALGFGSVLSTSVSDFNEAAQDAVGGILTDSSRIDFTYSDAGNTITADIITASVANSFLANMAQSTIKGRAEGAGTGVPTDLTPTQVASIIDGEAITWSALHTFTADILLSSANPRLRVQETGLTADTGQWDFSFDAGNMTVRTRTDADGSGFNLWATTRPTGSTTPQRMFIGNIITDPPGFSTTANNAINYGLVISETNNCTVAQRVAIPFATGVAGSQGGYHTIAYNTSVSSPSQIATGNILGANSFGGYNTAAVNIARTAIMRAAANETWTSTANGTRLELISTADGGSAVSTSLQLLGSQVKFLDGTVGAPAITWQSDTDTGRYRIGANQMGDAAAGVLQFEIGDSYSDMKTQARFTGRQDPAQFGANQNDFAVTATISRIYADSNASRDFTGMTGGVDGRTIFFHNDGATNPIVIKHESASSTAANRFTLPSATDSTIQPGGCAIFMYDGTASRWRHLTRLA